MAFVVEDGTGVAGANSFASVADADAYWTDRNNAAWLAYSSSIKQAALVEATEYLSTAFDWKGDPIDTDQPLAWPRSTVTDSIPSPVKVATYRVANSLAAGGVAFGSVEGADVIDRVKAGSVEVAFNARGANLLASGRTSWPWLYQLLAPWVYGTAGGGASAHRLVRV